MEPGAAWPRTQASPSRAASSSAWASSSNPTRRMPGSRQIRGTRRCCSLTSTAKTSTRARTPRHPGGSSTSTTASEDEAARIRASLSSGCWSRSSQNGRRKPKGCTRELWWQFWRDAPGYAEGDRGPGRGACHRASQQDRHAGAGSNWTGVRAKLTSSSQQTRLRIKPCCRQACTRCGRSSTARLCETTSALHAIGRVRDVPAPESTDWLAEIGRTLDTERREIMLRRDLGLTKLYNLVNDPDITDAAD